MKLVLYALGLGVLESPSVWRAWIEIDKEEEHGDNQESPSVWRAWIEIISQARPIIRKNVALRTEGVD